MKKILTRVGIVIVALILIIAIALFIVYRIAAGKIYDDSVPIVDRPESEAIVDADTETESEDPDETVDTVEEVEMENVPIYSQVPIEDEVFNVLLIGSDSRDPDKDRGRSDTMMLVSLNRTTNTATLVSFLRDSLLPIEGYGQSRLNHAYSWGGVGLTINTINDNFNLDIQNYIIVNFENLENIVDKLGGVKVNITAAEVAWYQKQNGITFVEGENTLTGEQALIHARNRYLDSDFGRTRRQRDVMMAMFNQVMSTKSITDITTLIQYSLSQVTTNIDPNELFTLAWEVVQLDGLELKQHAVPADGTWSNLTYKGMAVLSMDIEENAARIHEVLYPSE